MWIYCSNLDDGCINMIVQLLSALAGSFGFAVLFRLRKDFWIPASLGGMIVWGFYLFCMQLTDERNFISCLMASALAGIYSEILAKLLHAPATIFAIIAVIPLVPGSSLFYTMLNIVNWNTQQASFYCSQTIYLALAIASGISIVWTLWSILFIRNNKESH